MTKTRFVLSGYFGFKNFGDEAILSVIVNKLKEGDNSITIFSSNPQYTTSKFSGVKSVNTFNIPQVLKSIIVTDFVISGGGSLLQDTTSFKSLLYYLFVILAGLIFGKKVIIFAQGIGPINNGFGRFLTKMLLKKCTYISVRDSKSLELLNNWGISADLVCDPVFSTKIPNLEKTQSVAVQLRDFKTINFDFLDRLAQDVVNNFSDKTIEIFSFQDEIDLDVCKHFEKSINLLNPEIKTILHTGLSDEQVVSEISKSQYLIAMRFHAIIIGIISGIKTLCINYDIKVQKLAQEFNLPIIEINKDFQSKFEELKNINTEELKIKVAEKNFNWDGFNNAIK